MDLIVSLSVSRPFCRPFGQIFRHFGDGRSSSTSLYPIGCKRHSCMFTCSADEGGCKWHSDSCLAFKYARLYTTHRYRRCVLKVRSYGKGRAKKKRKNVPSLSKRNKKDSFVSVSVSKPSARISSCGSRVSYGVIAFPSYMEHDFEMFTAARLRPVRG